MWRRVFITLKLTWMNMMSAKLRTFLTILGIVIGISAVMIVMSIGESAQSLILDQVRGIGVNLIGVLPGASEEDAPPTVAFGIAVTSLKNSDLEAIQKKENVPHAQYAAGYVLGNETIEYGEKSYRASLQGVSSQYVDVESIRVVSGRFFSAEEDRSLSRVVVLGFTRARDLFGDQEAVGKTVKIRDMSFRVVGVLEERGSVAFSSPDTSIYVPLLTAQRLLLGIDYLSFIRVSVDQEQEIEKTKQDIRLLLRDRHNLETEDPDDFSIRSAEAALTVLTNITNALKYFLIAVASISLLVGGIGVMNILLIALKQRVRDIGLRKALGALNRDVFMQFIAESIFISFFGMIIGVVFGLLVTYGIALIIQSMGYEWPFIVTYESVGIAFVISLGIGIIFGLYPARKAVAISPTEALRYE